MEYKARDFSHLFGMKGFSRQLLENHFTLYQGYVENTNKLINIFAQADKNPKDPKFADLKRHFGWEWNGMRLHEYYFDNLGGDGKCKQSPLLDRIRSQYNSYEEWEKAFKAVGGMRGIGWAVLYFDQFADALCNAWINEHDGGHLAGCTPILIMDVFEHAFMIDYGVKKDGYINAFMENVNWDLAIERFKNAQQYKPVDAHQPVS